MLDATASSLEARAALPTAVQPFVGFAQLLRRTGFAVVTDQTVAFLRSITLLGPRSLADVYWAARATLAPPADRLEEFDALFEEAFGEDADFLVHAESTPQEEAPVKESGATPLEPVAAETANELGRAASAAEALGIKDFSPISASQRLEAMRRQLVALAPRRRGFRRVKARRGDRLDLRRSLAGMVHGSAESARPMWTERRNKPRRLLLLIDISGSMKAHTDDYLRFAHALTQSLPAVEAFAFGTRLTRLTKSLRRRDVGRALAEIAPSVADWSGGTRIGESLAAFLALPRFSRASRGALVIVLSDGLERGDVNFMASAVRRLAARSWRLAWLTPLAADPAIHAGNSGPARDPRRRRPPRRRRRHRRAVHIRGRELRSCRRSRPRPDAPEGGDMDQPIIDAHHHIWRQADLPWLAGPMLPRIFGPYEPIRRDYPIEEYLADIDGAGVRKSVYVQANWSPARAEDEVAWVQKIAGESGWPHGIVGYADLMAEDVRPALDALAQYPLMRGIRMQLHWHDNQQYRFASRPDVADDPTFRRNFRWLADYGFSFDLQVFAPQMEGAARLAADFPKTTFILQHAGMIEDLSDHGRAEWRVGMSKLAAQPNVYSKLSGLGTFIHRNDPEHITWIVRETAGLFGAERCLFGSNFPIEKLWTDYRALVAAYRAAVAPYSPAEQAAMLHDVTARVYRIM